MSLNSTQGSFSHFHAFGYGLTWTFLRENFVGCDYLTVDKSNSVVADDGDYFEHDNLDFR